MSVLDTYLKTVARFLPAADRDDIVRELAENLRSEIEDSEAERDRPLSDAEVQQILDAFGSPMEVAARYRPSSGMLAFGRVLVGPVIFPFYLKVLGFVLSLTAGAIVIIGIALGTPAGNVAQALLIHLAIQFGIVTAICSLAQVTLDRRPAVFDVSRPVSYIAAAGEAATPRVSRLESFAEIVVLAIMLAWLPALRDFARRAMMEAGLAPAPFWSTVYVVIAALWAAGIARAGLAFARPAWTRLHRAIKVASDIAFLVMIVALLAAGPWVTPLATNARSALAPGVIAAINRGFFTALLVTALVALVGVIVDLRRSLRASRGALGFIIALALLSDNPAALNASMERIAHPRSSASFTLLS